MEMPECKERKDLHMFQNIQSHQSGGVCVTACACMAALEPAH